MRSQRIFHYLALTFLYCCLSLSSATAVVTESPLALMETFMSAPLPEKKLTREQQVAIAEARDCRDAVLRIVSYNLLFDLYDQNHPEKHRWPQRQQRVVEHLQHLNADVIGTQELQRNQLDALMRALGDQYAYYGIGSKQEGAAGDFDVIIYRRDRLKLIDAASHTVATEASYGAKYKLVHGCIFCDKITGTYFAFLNAHLSFANMNNRHKEAKFLASLARCYSECSPVIVTGDFNTFPMLPEHDLPAYDGDQVLCILMSQGLCNSMQGAVCGHFGPLSTTNFCEESREVFVDRGTPGVMLDHVLVSDSIKVIGHVHDAARIDGEYASDHFPVVVDLLLPCSG